MKILKKKNNTWLKREKQIGQNINNLLNLAIGILGIILFCMIYECMEYFTISLFFN